MPRLMTLVLTVLCAGAIVAAQAPAGNQPSSQTPAAQQPAYPSPGQPSTPSTQRPSTESPSTQTPSSASPSTSTASTVTYTGCLKPGPTAGSWVLDSAELSPAMGASASTKTSSTDRAVATSGTMSTKESFMLVAKPSDNLKPHANHKIEVTGTTSPATAATMSSSSEAAGASATASATAAPKQNLNITSFKMVSSSCQ